jgi:hypothetical protein
LEPDLRDRAGGAGGEIGDNLDALDGACRPREVPEQPGVPAAPGADLEDAVPGLDVEEREHIEDQGRPRDRHDRGDLIAPSYPERAIAVERREVRDSIVWIDVLPRLGRKQPIAIDKEVPGDGEERVSDPGRELHAAHQEVLARER